LGSTSLKTWKVSPAAVSESVTAGNSPACSMPGSVTTSARVPPSAFASAPTCCAALTPKTSRVGA
jgi:hypothetical protein